MTAWDVVTYMNVARPHGQLMNDHEYRRNKNYRVLNVHLFTKAPRQYGDALFGNRAENKRALLCAHFKTALELSLTPAGYRAWGVPCVNALGDVPYEGLQ